MVNEDNAADPHYGHGTVFGKPKGFLIPTTNKERVRRRRKRRGEIPRQTNPKQGGEDEFSECFFCTFR
jgi:hypothetical protein